MAKISANGASRVAEVRLRDPQSGLESSFVLTSDGRILRRIVSQRGSYYVHERGVAITSAHQLRNRVSEQRPGWEVTSVSST